MGIVFAILILCAVIMFHEWGHYLFAKAFHITVLEFSFGLGPKILSCKRGETDFSWRAIPIGGMCRMLGEDEDKDAPGSFQNAKVWQRMLVVGFGPMFNFILAFLVALIVIFAVGADPALVSGVEAGSPAREAGLEEGDLLVGFERESIGNAREFSAYASIDGFDTDEINLKVKRDGQVLEIAYQPELSERYLMGYSYDATSEKPVITEILQGMPMQEAGFKAGDIITSINGTSITTTEDLFNYLEEHPFDGTPVEIECDRNGTTISATVVPAFTSSAIPGFSISMAREKQDLPGALAYGLAEVKFWIRLTVKSIASIFGGKFHVSDLSGPVGVVSTIDQAYNEAVAISWLSGFITLMNMIILISANLGVINLFPLPALDGGRLVFLIIEAIRRKKCNQTIEGYVHFIGFIALMALAVYIAINDVFRLL